MNDYSLAHLLDNDLLHSLSDLVARDRATTAKLLAHLAEVDTRRLYAPAGHSSMFAFCVEELKLSEGAAYRRIRAARAAREFPVLFEAVADGRLHLAAVSVLAPFLTGANVAELIEAATHRRKSEVEEWLARRFPGSGCPPEPAVVRPVGLVPGRVQEPNEDQLILGRAPDATSGDELILGRAPEASGDELILGRAEDEHPVPPPPERFLVQVTIGKNAHDMLRRAQALLSHSVPSGDVAQVVERALAALVEKLEKRKYGKGIRARGSVKQGTTRSRSTSLRCLSSTVRRAVWERDEGQCSFVSSNGHRCSSRRFLEFDHIDPVARGGRTTAENLRLRCRAHNRYAAEHTFGEGFMNRKRAEGKAAREAVARRTAMKEATQDVMAGLRSLGCRADEASRPIVREGASNYAVRPYRTLPNGAISSPANGHRRTAMRYGEYPGRVGEAFTYANAARMTG